MSSNDVQMLMEMGFSRSKAEKALEATGHLGVEAAMEWALVYGDELEAETSTPAPAPETSPPAPAPETSPSAPASTQPTSQPSTEAMESTDQGSSTSATSSSTPAEAKSLKCDECGKLFKTQLEVEFHAAKSGHSSFSESTEEKKPLTEEEKKEQLRKVEEKIKQKRLEREEKEKQDALERERNRIRSGKEMTAAKKKLEDEEMKKILEQRKREKLEDKLARERVKAQIEADKAARKAKFGGAPPDQAPTPAATPAPAATPVPAQPKDYTTTKLQIRLTNGQTLTESFNPKEQLSAVRLYVQMNRSDGEGPFSLMTNFPKKVFQDDDYEKPLDILGLVPSAVLIVTRAN